MTMIAPSLLAADFSRIGEEARRAFDSGADWLHLVDLDAAHDFEAHCAVGECRY